MDSNFMKAAIEMAEQGMNAGHGGPFGAAVVQVHANGTKELISCEHNRVLQTNDPTMHAEVAAIRAACEKLGRFSLHDCVIYSTCMPCPMCMSAIMWAKIPWLYYGAGMDDAAEVGFDDEYMYDFFRKGKEVGCSEKLRIEVTDVAACRQLFEQWKNKADRNMY